MLKSAGTETRHYLNEVHLHLRRGAGPNNPPDEMLQRALPRLVVHELGGALHRLVRVVICSGREIEERL